MKTCPSCSYPLVVRETGSTWCSVYGSHTWDGKRGWTRGEFAGLVSALIDAQYGVDTPEETAAA